MMQHLVTCGHRIRTAARILAGAMLVAVSVTQAQTSATHRSALLAKAPDSHEQAAKNNAEQQPPNITSSEAARSATRQYGGRVLDVVLEQGPGGPYYRVKLLDGGRVRVVHVEARD